MDSLLGMFSDKQRMRFTETFGLFRTFYAVKERDCPDAPRHVGTPHS